MHLRLASFHVCNTSINRLKQRILSEKKKTVIMAIRRPMLLRACHTAGIVLNVICASGGLMPTYPRSRNCSHSLLCNMALTPTAPIFIRSAVPTCKSPS